MSILCKVLFKIVRHLTISLTLAFFLFRPILADQPISKTPNTQQDNRIYLPVVLRQSDYSESTGILDPDFGGGDGKVTSNFGYNEHAAAVAIQPDGKIIVAGTIETSIYDNNYDFAVARYNPDGSLDMSFNGDGWVTTDFDNNFSASYDYGKAVVLQPDGKIVVAGDAYNADHTSFGLVRYNPDGSLDLSFGGGNGKLITDFGNNTSHLVDAALQPDGKIVVAGNTSSDIYGDFALARYMPDGSLDTSFDGDGRVVTNFDGRDGGVALALQPDGKIVVGGLAITNNFYDFAVVRFNSDGSLDFSFGGDGWVTTNIGSYYDYGNDIAIQSDGKIVIAGCTDCEPPSYEDFALARYMPDGSLDTSFDSDGIIITDLGREDLVNALALEPNGMIVVVGSTDIYGYNIADFALARYNPDGSLDMNFSGDGKITTDFYGNEDLGEAIALQPDGKIVAAGSVYNGTNYDFAIARYK